MAGSGAGEDVLRATPDARARAAADALGHEVLTAWCADLLAGRAVWGDPALPDVGWVGGRAAAGWGSPEHLDDDTRYWSRVWAARTLLHVWSDRCEAEVVAALADPAWRVREMCAKVATRWEVGSAAERCAELVTADDVPKVRAAAARALGAVGEAEHAAALHDAVDDPDDAVRSAAARALGVLARRLDREL